jgi:hypothetical protein
VLVEELVVIVGISPSDGILAAPLDRVVFTCGGELYDGVIVVCAIVLWGLQLLLRLQTYI